MAFSQATLTAGPLFGRDGQNLLIRWTSSSGAGTWFQLYRDRRLVWWGTGREVSVPFPSELTHFEVGTVLAAERQEDLSSSLPSLGGTGNRVTLTWTAGLHLGAGLAGFRIYGETSPGAGIDYGTVLAIVPLQSGGVSPEGYGLGGYGLGGYGGSAATYRWTSGPLRSGTWNFAVVPFDQAGNAGTATIMSRGLVVAPLAPALDANGQRLTYSYNPGSHIATLNWLASA